VNALELPAYTVDAVTNPGTRKRTGGRAGEDARADIRQELLRERLEEQAAEEVLAGLEESRRLKLAALELRHAADQAKRRSLADKYAKRRQRKRKAAKAAKRKAERLERRSRNPFPRSSPPSLVVGAGWCNSVQAELADLIAQDARNHRRPSSADLFNALQEEIARTIEGAELPLLAGDVLIRISPEPAVLSPPGPPPELEKLEQTTAELDRLEKYPLERVQPEAFALYPAIRPIEPLAPCETMTKKKQSKKAGKTGKTTEAKPSAPATKLEAEPAKVPKPKQAKAELDNALPRLGDRVVCEYMANGGLRQQVEGRVVAEDQSAAGSILAEVTIGRNTSKMSFGPPGSRASRVWIRVLPGAKGEY